MAYRGYEDLLVEVEGPVARFRINRPDKLNAYRYQTRAELFDLAARLQDDDSIRAVVCTATGRGFCSGADLASSREESAPPSRAERNSRLGQNAFAMLMGSLDKPTIASVNGIAAGGGMAWALSFDMRILGPQARFHTAFARRGFTPDNGLSYFLPRMVGEERAYKLLFSGREVGAEEALSLGLGLELVENPDARAMTLAHELAAGPPLTILWSKRAVQYARHHELDEVIEYERAAGAITRDSEDRREGVRAFIEKRRPVFTGN